LPLDGRNVLATLTSGQPSPHQEILMNTTPNGGAGRFGDWKLIVKPNAAELYNLREDPTESKNLAVTQPAKLEELRTHYDDYAQRAATPKNTVDDEDG
jgi:arylsulfatase A-like enzyme